MNPYRKRRSGGFTLIEVLLVLVILVVLASLAVVAYGPIQRKMQISAAKTQIGLIEQAVETYQVTVGAYPPNLEALRVAPADVPPGKWEGPYLNKEIPLDPWNHPYQYSQQSQRGVEFEVFTVAPDGQEIGNWTQDLKSH
jgi:general secretion pathway protein G